MAAVNHPTDTKQKELDVGRKLQLYGIISAFQKGKVPSNEQVDVALNSFLASRALSSPSDKLSAEGKTLVADVRDVVKQAQLLMLSKNEGNLIQDFIWQTQQFDPKSVSVPGAPVDKETAQQHADQALQGLRTLGMLIIRNGEFRKLLSDTGILVRDMAGDAATNAAAKVRPSQEQLDQMDRPAEDNVWHEAPDFSKASLKSKMQKVYKGSPRDDVSAAVDAQNTTALDADGRVINRQAALNATDNLQQRVSENMDPETKEKIKTKNEEYRRRVKEYFNRKMPQERKDQISFRLKKMVLECQQHPDYSQAIQALLTLAEEYGRHGRTLTRGGTGTVKETRTNLAAAEADLKTLIERFANGTSTDGLWDAVGAIYDDADKDEELKDWFKSMDVYIRRCLLQQGYILDDASNEEWNRLYDHGRYLLRDKYRTHTDRVLDEIKFLADQFDQDPHNKAFGLAVQKLFNDLGNDAEGKPTFKPHLVKDLTEVIIPAIFENVAYVPLPRIEYTDPQVDAIVENLVLESDNFTPNLMEIHSQHHFRFGRRNLASNSRQAIEVMVSGVQMDLRDVSYHLNRKKGFPSITDTGVADIILPGEGFSFKMKMSTAEASEAQNFFKVDNVVADIKGLDIKFLKSNHKFLLNLFKPVAVRVARPIVRKVVERAIKEQVDNFDAFLYQIKLEADRQQREVSDDQGKAPSAYSRYLTAVQNRVGEHRERAKAKAKTAAADKKVNFAITQEDSIFPNIHLPGGISSKASEYKEMAAKGEKWESPVFSIGSAPRSQDIPQAPKVVRKSGGRGINWNTTAAINA